jgi:hypothetical protein
MDFMDKDSISGSIKGGNLLRFYARKGDLLAVQQLVIVQGDGTLLGDSGQVLNDQCKGGFTALHIAAFDDHDDIVDYLANKCKANLNLETNGGETPLFLAVANGSQKSAKMLAEAGALYEFSAANGMVYRDRHLSSVMQAPVKPDAYSRNWKEVKNANVYMSNRDNDPMAPSALFPHGIHLASVGQQFVAGAAARYAHPTAGPCKTPHWKPPVPNEELMDRHNRIRFYDERWKNTSEDKPHIKACAAQRNHDVAQKAREVDSITGAKYSASPFRQPRGESQVKLNADYLLKKVILDTKIMCLPKPYKKLVLSYQPAWGGKSIDDIINTKDKSSSYDRMQRTQAQEREELEKYTNMVHSRVVEVSERNAKRDALTEERQHRAQR